MREDLQALLITYERFEELTGVNLDEIKYGITSEDIINLTPEKIANVKKHYNFESILNEFRIKREKKLPFREKISKFIYDILFSVVFLALFIQLLLWLIDLIFKTSLLNYKLPIANTPIYTLGILLGIWLGIVSAKESNIRLKENNIKKANRLESLVRLRELFIECENYNKVVKSIDVKDQISNVLEYNNDPVREEVITTLTKIHNNLIKALKICEILIENVEIVNIKRETLEITFAEIKSIDTTKSASHYSDCIEQIMTVGISLNQEFEKLYNYTDLQ